MAQRAGPSPSFCLEGIRQRFQAEGLPQEVADVAFDARRSSTIRVYDSRLEKFFSWAASNTVHPLEASVQQMISFFLLLFSEGKQASTIRNYRSAVGAIHKGFPDGSTLSNNQLIAQVLKGFFNRRPPQKRLAPSWSINDVLRTLAEPPYEPLHNTPLELLTYKTLFLVAAASARRRTQSRTS